MIDVTNVTANTGDPPKGVPAVPIELSGKTQKENRDDKPPQKAPLKHEL